MTEQQKAENIVLNYIQANYKEVISISDTAQFTALKKMVGYSNGVKQPVYYRLYYNTTVKDSLGSLTEKQVEIKLDSNLSSITEVIIPQEDDNSFVME